MAILLDNSPHWRPNIYSEGLWGSQVQMVYPVLKIIDFVDQKQKLLDNKNPFAVIILAQLMAIETAKNHKLRLVGKLEITKELLRRGYCREEILQLYYFIEAVLVLPEPLSLQYHTEVRKIEEEQQVKFITTAERIGRQEGESSLLLILLECKFKHVPEEYINRIRKANEDILLTWGKRFVTAETLEDIFIA